MTMTNFDHLWKLLKFVSDAASVTPQQREILIPILEAEATARELKHIRYLLQRSGIKVPKRIEDFDWTFNPKIPRNIIMPFFHDFSWIAEAKNIVFIGASGTGKSHLASALCYHAINQQAIPTARITCFDLVKKLNRSRNKYTMLQYYSTVKILCLDELGYVFPNQDEANDIFQIISKRTELLPTIVTTNLIPSQWGKVFEAATATAILDRLSFRGSFIKCEGRSYRSKK